MRINQTNMKMIKDERERCCTSIKNRIKYFVFNSPLKPHISSALSCRIIYGETDKSSKMLLQNTDYDTILNQVTEIKADVWTEMYFMICTRERDNNNRYKTNVASYATMRNRHQSTEDMHRGT